MTKLSFSYMILDHLELIVTLPRFYTLGLKLIKKPLRGHCLSHDKWKGEHGRYIPWIKDFAQVAHVTFTHISLAKAICMVKHFINEAQKSEKILYNNTIYQILFCEVSVQSIYPFFSLISPLFPPPTFQCFYFGFVDLLFCLFSILLILPSIFIIYYINSICPSYTDFL